jgi:hypothetical protein
MKKPVYGALVLALILSPAAQADQYVFPAKGQSPDQQKSDEAACRTWATQQTGFDPAKPPPPPPPAKTGANAGSGARGAARGAVVGEIIADDAGAGAAVGAVAARGQSRRQNRQDAAQGQQQQSSATQTQQANYDKARGACLEGKGYTVK